MSTASTLRDFVPTKWTWKIFCLASILSIAIIMCAAYEVRVNDKAHKCLTASQRIPLFWCHDATFPDPALDQDNGNFADPGFLDDSDKGNFADPGFLDDSDKGDFAGTGLLDDSDKGDFAVAG
ncbi:unnamed protein product [Heligmosomoides polygyrus]|uniref:AGC-kinase C-terminal domain-containing protein n=1 Tax=Heligmosomoides polygyrus TaxID=6339 RepID=A0A183FQP0_HELPZ|nr:unnamed protein product [Heligmosomoides polygyrus]